MSMVWLIHLSSDDNWVDVLQVCVFDLFEWRSDLCLFRVTFCTAFPPHNRTRIVEQLFEFCPMNVWWILAVAMQILNDVFGLEDLR